MSFCWIGRQPVFLDVLADRYFCLSASAERCFADIAAAGGHVAEADSAVDGMLSRGLLVEAGGAPLVPCRLPSLPEESVLDHALPRATLGQTATALGRILSVKTRLRRAGLARTLSAIATAKQDSNDSPANAAFLLDRSMAGFVRAAGVATVLDNCLCQSLAVGRTLLARGLRPEIVLGVRLGPFAAHCWVQHHDRLVNDRFDMVRTFTPILII